MFLCFICSVCISVYFILVYFDNTHQVRVELPLGVGGLIAILVYLYNTHYVLVGLPQRVGGLANLNYFILFYIILFYFSSLF